jgi:hypothetical protein
MDPSSSQATPSKAIGKRVKGGKMRQMRYPRRVAVATNDDDKEVDGSDKDYVMAIEHDFKHQAHQPNNHFEKHLKTACPNHTYPVKHKLKHYTMMKNFMTSGAHSKGKKSEGDPGRKGTTSFHREAVPMMIYG